MFNIAICDGLIRDITRLKKCIDKNDSYCSIIRIHEYQNGNDLLNGMNRINFSLIFLDVYNEQIKREQTAEKIREMNQNVVLVFYSEEEILTPHMIELQPYRYVQKNLTEARMSACIRESLEKMVEVATMPTIEAKYYDRKLYIKPYDIVFMEKYKKNTRVYISDAAKIKYDIELEEENESVIRTIEKLGVLYERLKCYGFGYPHDSYIINFKYLISCTDSEFRISDFTDSYFKITRSKASEFNKQKQEFLQNGYKGK